MRTASATRSVTESKNAPRTEAVPAALATGPSSRSWSPVTISITMAQCRCPVAMRTAVTVADRRPVAVSTSAVTPRRCSAVPTGPVDRSTAARQRPSNMELLVVRWPWDRGRAVCKSLPSRRRNSGSSGRFGPGPRWRSGGARGALPQVRRVLSGDDASPAAEGTARRRRSAPEDHGRRRRVTATRTG